MREVMPKLDIDLIDLREALCCGDPIRSVNDFATTYLSARILALADLTGLNDLLIPCNRCHFTISEAKHAIDTDTKTHHRISELLKEEDLAYNENIRLWHTIDFLHDKVSIKSIRKIVCRPLKGLKLAAHVGCQVIRYSDLGRPDNAENPKKLDELIRAIGGESVDYAEKLDCCGAHLTLSHPDSALSLSGSKLKAVQSLGVDGMVISCPDCGIMFDSKQKEESGIVGTKLNVPVVYYSQLLGLSLGLEKEKLGLHVNQSPVDQLLAKISE
jgi:heterodisulfide reductase subunit B